MNVLLIGGSGTLIDNLIIKFKKEGHRVCLLTGSRYQKTEYQRVFETYRFPYDCNCLKEIFGSVNPDLTIYMGAFDTNYRWREEEQDAVRFSSGLMNLLMGYSTGAFGRFLYLSSDEVYGRYYAEDIPETEPPEPVGIRGMALAQAEDMCRSYQKNREMDLIVLRLDHFYAIPRCRDEVRELCGVMCLEALERQTITIIPENKISLLYESDAVELIFQVATCKKHGRFLYNISSRTEWSQRELAEIIQDAMGDEVQIAEKPGIRERRILSGALYESEFGSQFHCDVPVFVKRTVSRMKRHSQEFLTGQRGRRTLIGRMFGRLGWLIRALIPFAENLAAFIPFFMLNNRTVGSPYFSNLDFYLLYVLLFAIVYGQQQAIFSALLAVAGYCFRQTYERTGFELMLDAGTYLWIAQLFILGMTVGYMRDQIRKLKQESEEEQDFLSMQLADIQEINGSNERVKESLQAELINQNDSVGKIYSITSALDQYSPEEVLFYAAETLGRLMKCKDVAIYTVSNADYARLFSATSAKAKSLGNSIRYTGMGELYETIRKRSVFINRQMDQRYPLMANAIYEQDAMEMIIMVWGLPWERMTLGQANQLVVISALIQNAVLRANRYLATLEQQRYIDNTPLLETGAFSALVEAYLHARSRGLTSCTLLRIQTEAGSYKKTGMRIASMLRQSDYIGVMEDGGLYALLANTEPADACHVIRRFQELGVTGCIVEDGGHDAA